LPHALVDGWGDGCFLCAIRVGSEDAIGPSRSNGKTGVAYGVSWRSKALPFRVSLHDLCHLLTGFPDGEAGDGVEIVVVGNKVGQAVALHQGNGYRVASEQMVAGRYLHRLTQQGDVQR